MEKLKKMDKRDFCYKKHRKRGKSEKKKLEKGLGKPFSVFAELFMK